LKICQKKLLGRAWADKTRLARGSRFGLALVARYPLGHRHLKEHGLNVLEQRLSAGRVTPSCECGRGADLSKAPCKSRRGKEGRPAATLLGKSAKRLLGSRTGWIERTTSANGALVSGNNLNAELTQAAAAAAW
jgi:hypothetical protein